MMLAKHVLVVVVFCMIHYFSTSLADDGEYKNRSTVFQPNTTTLASKSLHLPSGLGGEEEVSRVSRLSPTTTTTTTTKRTSVPANRPKSTKSTRQQEIHNGQGKQTPAPTNKTVVIVAIVVTVGVVVVAVVAAVTVVLYRRKTVPGNIDTEINAQPNDYRTGGTAEPSIKGKVTSGNATEAERCVMNTYTNRSLQPDNESVYEVIVETNTLDGSSQEISSKRSGPLPRTPASQDCANDYVVFQDTSSPADDYYSYATNDSILRGESSVTRKDNKVKSIVEQSGDEGIERQNSDRSYFG